VISPARHSIPAATLAPETFTTSRLGEFNSRRELVAQTGPAVADWPLVVVKEFTDNAIDLGEELGTAPLVNISVDCRRGEIVVADNGHGTVGEVAATELPVGIKSQFQKLSGAASQPCLG
jgi:DNA topoisomerase VI subunit B